MNTARWYAPVAVALLIVGVGATYAAYGAQQEQAAESARRLAAAKDTVADLQLRLTATAAQLGAARAKVDTVWRVRTVYLAAADSSHHVADSLIALAPDPAAVCRTIQAAYDARTSECAQLRQVVAVQDTGLRVAAAALQQAQDSIRAAGQTTAGLRAQLAQVAKPYACRWLGLLPCPSRTTVFVAGAVAGVGLSRLAH